MRFFTLAFAIIYLFFAVSLIMGYGYSRESVFFTYLTISFLFFTRFIELEIKRKEKS